MAFDVLRLSCPIDGLELDLSQTYIPRIIQTSPLDTLAPWYERVGGVSNLQFDRPAACPNGHRWGINYRVEIERTA